MKYTRVHETHVYLLRAKQTGIVYSLTSDSGEYDWTKADSITELLGHRVIRWVDDELKAD
jgi:hypothetical protein